MIRRVLLVFLMLVVAVELQSKEITVTALRSYAMKGLNMEVGYEQEMAAWAYYRINGADGVAIDYNDAVEMLEKLVTRDKYNVASNKFTYVVEGYNLLGNCYEKGWGVSKNIDTAKKYWQLAANYNHADARKKLDQYKSRNNKSNQAFTVNGVSFKMIYVEGGTFRMGSNDSEAYDDEKPIHSVTLSDYYIGETEVTQELWEAVMGSNSSGFKGLNRPVENVSWYDCQEFIKRLNNLTGRSFRLPTEAEWEYAARGGNKSRGYKYSGSDFIDEVAWYGDNAGEGVGENSSSYGTHRVGVKNANEIGLYDMSGNVWEWCSDWYSKDYYLSSLLSNPIGPSTGSHRVLRGGSWYGKAQSCRESYRYDCDPGKSDPDVGFRLVIK